MDKDFYVPVTKVTSELTLLSIPKKDWHTLTLAEVIKQYNQVRENLASVSKDEQQLDSLLSNLNSSYQKIRLMIIQGKNKKSKKAKSDSNSKDQNLDKEVQDIKMEETSNMSFEYNPIEDMDLEQQINFMKPEYKTERLIPESRLPLPLPEKFIGSGTVLNIDQVYGNQPEYPSYTRFSQRDIIIPEDKNYGNMLIYSDNTRLLSLIISKN